MSRYTYTLNPSQGVTEKHTYRQSELEKMTTFHLREICRKERLVVSSAKNDDKDGLIRLIMRFRGQKEYRHIREFCEGGMERIQEFLKHQVIRFLETPEVDIPGTITIFHDTEMNELDGYRIKSEEKLFAGNLLLVDEAFKIYTCFYIEEIEDVAYLFKGKGMPVVRWRSISIPFCISRMKQSRNFCMTVITEIMSSRPDIRRLFAFRFWMFRKDRFPRPICRW